MTQYESAVLHIGLNYLSQDFQKLRKALTTTRQLKHRKPIRNMRLTVTSVKLLIKCSERLFKQILTGHNVYVRKLLLLHSTSVKSSIKVMSTPHEWDELIFKIMPMKLLIAILKQSSDTYLTKHIVKQLYIPKCATIRLDWRSEGRID